MNSTYVLTLSCKDKPGIVHAVSGFLLEQGGNIEEAAQYNDHDTGLFFMRVQFVCDARPADALQQQVRAFAEAHQMQWGLHPLNAPMRTVLLVSQQGHCLNDLLFRWKSGLLRLDIRAIISNHRDFYQLAASYNIPFHHLPVTPSTKGKPGSSTSSSRNRPNSWSWRAICRSCPTRCASSWRARPSTSTTASCPASRAPSLTTRRTTVE
jgi:formyltetrahydrofolate deformylase